MVMEDMNIFEAELTKEEIKKVEKYVHAGIEWHVAVESAIEIVLAERQ